MMNQTTGELADAIESMISDLAGRYVDVYLGNKEGIRAVESAINAAVENCEVASKEFRAMDRRWNDVVAQIRDQEISLEGVEKLQRLQAESLKNFDGIIKMLKDQMPIVNANVKNFANLQIDLDRQTERLNRIEQRMDSWEHKHKQQQQHTPLRRLWRALRGH